MELGEKFKQEKGDSTLVTISGKQVTANDFMNFKFDME